MVTANRVIAFTPEQDAALRAESVRARCSVSELVRRSVTYYLKDAAKPQKEPDHGVS
jgi:hypothetical protein